jgi:hypothetical protein
MGAGAGQYFPVDPARGVTGQIPGYNKRMNGDLAKATDLKDLSGTDLRSLLEDIRKRILD